MKDRATKQDGSGESRRLALFYMKALIDIARESFLILDSDLKVISANPIFYQTFRVPPEKTEHQFIYELGDGKWNIPGLKNLLEKVLPEEKAIENYEIEHAFKAIGERTILLSAKQIDPVGLIVLAMADITSRKEFEEKKNEYAKELECEVCERTKALSDQLKKLELLNRTMVGRELKMAELKKEMIDLKKQLKNCEDNHKNG
jgi:nitrogen-specific signal transduction histidine kinase